MKYKVIVVTRPVVGNKHWTSNVGIAALGSWLITVGAVNVLKYPGEAIPLFGAGVYWVISLSS